MAGDELEGPLQGALQLERLLFGWALKSQWEFGELGKRECVEEKTWTRKTIALITWKRETIRGSNLEERHHVGEVTWKREIVGGSNLEERHSVGGSNLGRDIR